MSLMLVTGAATGLGLHTAQALLADGHEVVVHARHPSRLAGVPELASVRGALFGDLADATQTLELAERANEHGRFDAVIHNAGIIGGPDVVAVNTVAPYLLTARMKRPGRIIVVSSSMHRSGSTHLSGLASGRKLSYSDSKLYLTAFAAAIAQRWDGTVAHSVDPGWVPTRMGGPSAPDDLVAGHETQVWLATSDHVDPPTGGYWHHKRLGRPHPSVSDPGFQGRVLAALEAHTGVALD